MKLVLESANSELELAYYNVNSDTDRAKFGICVQAISYVKKANHIP